tara:strand:- start:9 stop:686 length:678 start_codon:yes stop_codon:yes gene_type:complete
MQNAVIKNTALAAVLATGTMFTTVAQAASIEGNVGITSDYIWRGMTQSDGESSFSGGIDISTDGGFYAGTWVGDVKDTAGTGASYELDVYVGYAGEAGSISYDVGYIQYMYPDVDADQDFGEVYVGLGTGPVSVTYYYEVDNDDGSVDSGDNTYLSFDASTDISEDWGVSLHYGIYDKDTWTDEQIDMSLTLSKGDFSFSLVETDDIGGPDDDDTRAVISYGMSF